MNRGILPLLVLLLQFFLLSERTAMLLFLTNSILLGFGLAMDAFSVSIANGLREPDMARRRIHLIAGTYAGFQFLMPMIGWLCVHTILEYFQAFRALIPWIALILLAFIGGNMIRESLRGTEDRTEEEHPLRLDTSTLLLQGIATSIDALSVGFTISEYDLSLAAAASLIIALVTHSLCVCGLLMGRKLGARFSGKAAFAGGLILIGIGIEIFLRAYL